MCFPLQAPRLTTSSVFALLFSILNCVVSGEQAPVKYAWITVPDKETERPLLVMEATASGIGACPFLILWADGTIIWRTERSIPLSDCDCNPLILGNDLDGYTAEGYRRSIVSDSIIQQYKDNLDSEGVFQDIGRPASSLINWGSSYSVVAQTDSAMTIVNGQHRIVEAHQGWVLEADGPRVLDPSETVTDALSDAPPDFMRHRRRFEVFEQQAQFLVDAAEVQGGYSDGLTVTFLRRYFDLPTDSSSSSPPSPTGTPEPTPTSTPSGS